MENSKTQPILTLSVAAQLLGIHPRTLMLYEKEGAISAHRTTTNRRLFSKADLEEIQFIKYLVEEKKITLAGVKLVQSLLAKAKDKYPGLKRDFFPDFSPKQLI